MKREGKQVIYRCQCGRLVEFEVDDGDCEDDEIGCPACGTYTSVNNIRPISPVETTSRRTSSVN